MSLLMNALYEYRISKYNNVAEYRKKTQRNELLHLCLVEEAHNVLLTPRDSGANGSPQSAAADLFGNMPLFRKGKTGLAACSSGLHFCNFSASDAFVIPWSHFLLMMCAMNKQTEFRLV